MYAQPISSLPAPKHGHLPLQTCGQTVARRWTAAKTVGAFWRDALPLGAVSLAGLAVVVTLFLVAADQLSPGIGSGLDVLQLCVIEWLLLAALRAPPSTTPPVRRRIASASGSGTICALASPTACNPGGGDDDVLELKSCLAPDVVGSRYVHIYRPRLAAGWGAAAACRCVVSPGAHRHIGLDVSRTRQSRFAGGRTSGQTSRRPWLGIVRRDTPPSSSSLLTPLEPDRR